jgi:hypothetical protein
MRTAALLLLFQCMGCSWLFATDAPGISLRCISQGRASGENGNEPLYYFSDQALHFQVNAAAPLGARIMIYADLFQTASGGWSAMLLQGHPISREIQFDSRTDLDVACTLPGLPQVTRPVKLLLKMYVRLADQPKALRPAGTVDLYLFPRLSAAEWQALFIAYLSQGGLAHVAVFGGANHLRDFLRRQQIAFDDLGADWPQKFDSSSLYLGDSPPAAADPAPSSQGIHAALFLPYPGDSALLPGIYAASDASGGAVVKVTLPGLLDGLEEDPRSQQTFKTIIQQTLNLPRSADNLPRLTRSQIQ